MNAQTGQLLWQSYSRFADNHGVGGAYAGATMFSVPTVDVADGLVFGTFGKLYTEPATVLACNRPPRPTGSSARSCEQPGAFWKSIVAFRLDTGAARLVVPRLRRCSWRVTDPRWRARAARTAAVAVVRAGLGRREVGRRRVEPERLPARHATVVGFGGKSGVYYLFDARTVQLLWNTVVGPGGDQGGLQWGTAYDGRRIYASLTNQHHIPYRLTQNGTLTSTTVTGGSWAALDPATGRILWQTADPQSETLPAPPARSVSGISRR